MKEKQLSRNSKLNQSKCESLLVSTRCVALGKGFGFFRLLDHHHL